MNQIVRCVLASLFMMVLTSVAAVGQESPSYNAQLDEYPYPFPVETFEFTSQRQTLQMAYMHLKGSDAMPTVVLLHGKNFSGSYWEQTAKLLQSKGYSVLIPDQIGFGKSSKPAYYQFGFPQLAYNTRQLIEKLGIKKTIIVGHSMGGMLATRYTLMFQSDVDRLILVNPIGLEDYLKFVQYKDVQFFYQNEIKKTPAGIKAYQLENYYDGRWESAYDDLMKIHVGWINGPDWERVAWNNAMTYDMIFSQPVCNEWADIEVPTRLIIGTRDRTGPGRGWKRPGVDREMGQYQNLGKQTAAQIEDSQLYELEGLGHMPQIEAFDRFRIEFEKALSQ
ncbi:hydrolase, alpha/beta fold family protein [Rhodopirellula maiorica SM1]|uniref:Hydrolase, alpha/beta fold family protein n=1 Tax=Rhodopirellula maiorica SM1 TaxID=1265738 RepID=M5RXN7_9BACT|nr:alpha/beta hydrolase [Rhodopirellula maiorica]EMI20162.1 hydrolase, alpha/beta fold family protein [Rhodopirellula maiorica SM1]